ncbi:DnaB-like helicase C-terminal domain-containing protein [Terracidiphilus gabretensis]|uniref:DnaB-like helicase C-terminal domain-containing protein n=1 Tax=Terracidiphilus gabretensis TaxID=1577687 RepID=UPI0022B09EC9|nr:DnaB-like helicase C-terminal domain-containing protein [Terracidiphilus gabretensis]
MEIYSPSRPRCIRLEFPSPVNSREAVFNNLRESGLIEQDAGAVALIPREDYCNREVEQSAADKAESKIIIAR